MNYGHREDNNTGCCYFHPREVVIGVCALCLNERLLILAAKQGHGHHLIPSSRKYQRKALLLLHGGGATNNHNKDSSSHHRRPSINLHKIFAFGAFLNRHWKSDSYDVDPCGADAASTSSQEDSFISIKFEGNGVASWDSKGSTVSKGTLDHCNNKSSWEVKNHCSYKESKQDEITKETLSVIEHTKPRSSSLRWRRRIGQMFQLIRWKRSSKGSVCHVGAKVEGVKARKGWMRTLTKRRTKE